jgi:hypothetical protein
MTWKEKHKMLLRNKKDIIKQYKGYIPIKLIAREYGVSPSCITINLKVWGVRRRGGIKYLLGKMILEGDSNGRI